MSEPETAGSRKHYLDRLRVLGILVVFPYHSCRFQLFLIKKVVLPGPS